MQIASTHLDELVKIKKNVRASHEDFAHNNQAYNYFREFVFKSSISDQEKTNILALKKPVLECNVLEAYVSRLRGEFSKQLPSITVVPLNNYSDMETVDVVERYMRAILIDANDSQFENSIWMDTLTGGFSVIEVYVDYEGEESFNQVPFMCRAYDPTMCGFIGLPMLPHKGDADAAYKLTPMTREAFEADFPNVKFNDIRFSDSGGEFMWFYKDGEQEVVLVCDYYKKVIDDEKLYLLSNQETMTEDAYSDLIANWHSIENPNALAAPPEIVKTRTVKKTKIWHYKFCGDIYIDRPYETIFNKLPLIFVDGNSIMLKNASKGALYQFTRPYIYHARDIQKLKNFAMQSYANEMENSEQHKWVFDIDSVPSQYLDNWLSPQVPGGLPYRSRNDENEQLNPPQAVSRTPIPQEFYQAFTGADQAIQNVLGSYDTGLGVNKDQLSGVAIVEGATQNNSVAMPYVINFMSGLNQAAAVILDIIPKLLVTPRTIPLVDRGGQRTYQLINDQNAPQPMKLDFPSNALNVRVEASPSFAVEKNRALEQMAKLSQAFPAFGQFINEKGLAAIISNLDFKGSDQLKEDAIEYMEEMEQAKQKAAQSQQQQLNPLMLMQQELQMKQQEMQMNAKNDAKTNEIKEKQLELQEQELQNERTKTLINAKLKTQGHKIDQLKTVADIQQGQDNLAVEHLKNERAHVHATHKLAADTAHKMATHNQKVQQADADRQDLKEQLLDVEIGE